MGVVEVIPGVSGGTIALLTGIYTHLVESLKQLDYQSWKCFDRNGLLNALSFLMPLGLGMLVGVAIAIFSVVEVVQAQPRLFWGAIFGLLISAVIYIARDTPRRSLAKYAPIGLILGILVIFLPSPEVSPQLWIYFLGGVGAFSAWILPGISGSMVLLLMGVWLPLLEAIRMAELTKLALFVGGVCVAFALLPRFLSTLLQRYRVQMMGVFVGLVASTLLQAWPWKTIGGVVTWPSNVAGDPQTWMVVLIMITSFILVQLLVIGLKRGI